MSSENIKQCTNCGAELDSLKVFVELRIKTKRKTISDIWEEVGNMDIKSNEILCVDCFDILADNLHSIMNKKEEK